MTMTESNRDIRIQTDDGLEIPNWFNTGFLEKHLRNYYQNDAIEIESVAVSSATAAGENFASYIYRVNLTFRNNSTDSDQPLINQKLILKVALFSGLAFETLSAHNVYDKEIEFYSEIVPQIKRLLNALGEPNQLFAETIGVCKANKVIIFEDLAAKGYSMFPAQRGFNIFEAKAILKKIATFHGICAVLQEQQPNVFENFKYGAMNRNSDVFHTFYHAQIDVIIEVVSSWPDYEHYVEKLRRLRSEIVERGCQMFDPDPDHFMSLNHGDLWQNNVMIKPKVGAHVANYENVVFIDFQDSYWASPANDLHYFFNSSLRESLRPNAFDDLIIFYHKHLEEVLQRLNFQKHIPTELEFLEQFDARYFYGLVTAFTMQPCIINESTEDADLDAMITNNERSMKYRRNMFQQPKIQANLRKLIPIYDDMGLFD